MNEQALKPIVESTTEVLPSEYLPIIEWKKQMGAIPEGVIVHQQIKKKEGAHTTITHIYKTALTIREHAYTIYIQGRSERGYDLHFETADGYARTKLSTTEREKLFSTISLFLGSLKEEMMVPVSRISVSPASVAYTSTEVRRAEDKIQEHLMELEQSGKTDERDVLLEQVASMEPEEKFELYKKITGEYLHGVPVGSLPNFTSARLAMFKKYLSKYPPKGWNVVWSKDPENPIFTIERSGRHRGG